MRSAISIPPYSEALAKFVDRHWIALADPEAVTDKLLANIAASSNGKFSVDQINAEAERRRGDDEDEELTEEALRKQEYSALIDGRDEVKAPTLSVSKWIVTRRCRTVSRKCVR